MSDFETHPVGTAKRIAELEAQLEALRKESERKHAFIERVRLGYQLVAQNYAEGYYVLSGVFKSFETPRAAIDAAIKEQE